jgi:hypothetical protein
MQLYRFAIPFIAVAATIAVAFFLAQEESAPDARSCLSLLHERRAACLDAVLRRVAKTEGIRAALDIIEPLSQENRFILEWSHPLAHSIGGVGLSYYANRAAGRLWRASPAAGVEERIGRALVSCDGYGAFGCYHGVIETGLSLMPPKDRPSVIRRACLKNALIQENQYFVNQFLHWFGHGLAIFTDNTLPETLTACENLSREFLSDEVQLCLSGVFHAGAVPGDSDKSLLHNVSRVRRDGDPYYPCQEIEERFRGHCFSHAAGRTLSDDAALNFQVCDGIPEPEALKKTDYVKRCYDSVANTVLAHALEPPGLTRGQRIEKIINDCRAYASDAHRRFCYGGAARYWVLRDPSLANADPFELCRLIEEDAKQACYGSIGFGNNENYYSSDKLKTYCERSEPKYVSSCIARQVL